MFFSPRGEKNQKARSRGHPLKNPVLIGKNPMIFTELNRNKKITDKNPKIFVGEEQVSRKSVAARLRAAKHKGKLATSALDTPSDK